MATAHFFDLFMDRNYNDRMFDRLGPVTDAAVVGNRLLIKFWCSGTCPPDGWLLNLACEAKLGRNESLETGFSNFYYNGKFVVLFSKPLPLKAFQAQKARLRLSQNGQERTVNEAQIRL